MPPRLEFDGIGKGFFGVPVLRNVSFRVGAGRTLGLVGENGAGKSTLMNLLGGNLRPDAGGLRLDGRPYAPRGPADAARHGIAFIHQELNLFPNLSIAENLSITDFPMARPWPFIDRRALRARTGQLLRRVGLHLPPETFVERLSTGERQLVEIARALGVEARLILFDEPTTSLTAREKGHLFELMAQLQRSGQTMIYISHALEDVLRLCDDLVVLRDGEVVDQGPRRAFDPNRLISRMVGRSITQLFPERPAPPPARSPVLEVRRLSQPGIVRDITFTLYAGEVLGLAGLMGSGRSELARILFGLEACQEGEVWLEGRRLARRSPGRCLRRRMAFVTEDRRAEGLCLEASIDDNLALVSLSDYARNPVRWIDRARLDVALTRVRESVRLTSSAGGERPVKTLSGGNQQKTVLAKWLLSDPRVFLLDEPTRGIDVGAKYEIYSLINELAGRGAGILMISSEIEELLGLCDRILVLGRGEIRDELRRSEFDRERILRSAMKGSRGAEAG